MRTVLTITVLLLVASSAWAQSSTVTAEWDYIGRPIAQVSKEPQTLLIDGVAVSATPTCIAKPGGTANDSMCSVSFPTPAPGPKTYTVRAVQGGVTAQAVFPGLDIAAAKPPTGFRPTITVTVTITP